MIRFVGRFLAFCLLAASVPAGVCANQLKGHEYAVSEVRFFEQERDFSGFEMTCMRFIPGRGVTLLSENNDGLTTGSCVSPVLKSPFPMTELLPSWNVDLPTSAGVTIFAQVSRDGETWSDWLYIGRDGAAPRVHTRNTTWDGVDVDVDYLLISKPLVYYRWRVDLSGINSAMPSLRLFAVCAGHSAGDKALFERHGTRPAPDSKPAEIRLEVPWRSQRADDVPKRIREAVCCPTSIAMVLEYHGKDLTTSDVCDLNYDRDYRIWGVWPKSAQTLSRFGLRSWVMQARSLEDLRPWLERGLPVIISVKAFKGDITTPRYYEATGHIMVVSGMDAEGNLWINDPYGHRESEPLKWTRAEMEKILIGRGGVVIVAEPRSPRRSGSR